MLSENAISLATTTKERWYEPEVYRIAGEIALVVPDKDTKKAERQFSVFTISRPAATSQMLGAPRRHEPSTPLARSEEGERRARLLAPVYGWFTEGLDTRDLKEAKGLL